jgi:hypothetical protein
LEKKGLNTKLNFLSYEEAIFLCLFCMGGRAQSEQLVYTLGGPKGGMKPTPATYVDTFLAKHVWPNFNRRSVYRWLRRMLEDGRLEREFHGSLGRPKSFYIHPQAYASLKGEPLAHRVLEGFAKYIMVDMLINDMQHAIHALDAFHPHFNSHPPIFFDFTDGIREWMERLQRDWTQTWRTYTYKQILEPLMNYMANVVSMVQSPWLNRDIVAGVLEAMLPNVSGE